MEKNIKEIFLTQGLITLISEIDFLFILNLIPWHVMKGKKTQYAVITRRIDNKNIDVYMHNLIFKRIGLIVPNHHIVDHINRNGLHNYRSNLRIATRVENQINKGKRIDNKSGYIGVYSVNEFDHRAFITINGKYEYIDTFTTAEMAARVRDYHAIKYYGKFAVLNFLESKELYKF